MKLSVIIVNYNVQHFLEQCLYSVYKATRHIEAEIFVVDNNSADGSLAMLREKFPDVVLMANKENVGFARANNQALKLASGEYVLLLNPDTLVESDTFTKCLDFMDNTPDAGAVGVKMINGKGEFLPESKRGLPLPHVAFYKIFGFSKLFPKSKKFGSYHLTYLDNNKIHSVEVLSGAFMMIRKKVLDQTGFLDEDYFMYGEDIDLSYRIILSGYKNYYYPETKIIHYKGESTKKGSLNYVFVFYRAMQIFVKKHFAKANARVFGWIMNIAIWLRAAASFLKRFLMMIFLPLIDFLVIYAGMLILSVYWEHTVLSIRDSHFPDEYRFIIIPIYIIAWIIAIALCGGYKKPVQLTKTNRGILLGTIAILIIYALLPESLRFSRAIIIFGAMWTIISLNSIRYLFSKLQFKDFVIGSKSHYRIAIVGDPEESERVTGLTLMVNTKIEYIGRIMTETKADTSGNQENILGSIGQIKDIIPIFNIREIIFCNKNLSTKQIIDLMDELKEFRTEFKIAQQDTNTIIGSNTISTPENIFTCQKNSLAQRRGQREKRLFDIVSSMILILLLPIDIWFVKKKGNFIRNLLSVLSGRKTWVAYQYPRNGKNGILKPTDMYPGTQDQNLIEKINQLYVNDYQPVHDFKIIWKNFSILGR